MFIQAIIRKYLLFIPWLTVLIFSINCAGSDNSTDIPAGEVKISYFVISQGMMKKEPSASYLALLSREWWARRQKKLNEPFEQLKLPPSYPAVKITPDDAILGLLELMENEGFYSLPSVNLKKYALAQIESMDFRIHILTIEQNGFSYSVAMENLPPDKQQGFLRIANIFQKNYSYVKSWKTEIIYDQNLDKILKQQPKENQNEDNEKKD